LDLSYRIIELKKGGVDWKKVVQTKCFEVACSASVSMDALIALYTADVVLEELDVFSDAVIIRVLKRVLKIKRLEESGPQTKEYIEKISKEIEVLKCFAGSELLSLYEEEPDLWNLVFGEKEEVRKECLRYFEVLTQLYRKGFLWEKLVALPVYIMRGYIKHADLVLKIVKEHSVSIENVLECSYANFRLLDIKEYYCNFKKYNIPFAEIREMRSSRLRMMLERCPSEMDEYFSFRELSRCNREVLQTFDTKPGILHRLLSQGISMEEIQGMLKNKEAGIVVSFLENIDKETLSEL
jgi:hypothetical protein